MKIKNDMLPWVLIGIAALFTMGVSTGYTTILNSFIPSVEGFSAYPIWDYDQWSWGYGTAAGFDKNKKPPGTITKAKALQDSQKVWNDQYSYLKPKTKKTLNAKQWAALLSFSYNLGAVTGAKIVTTINTGTTSDVVTRMKKYVYVDGKYNQGLANRRKKETDLYTGIDVTSRGMPEAAEMPLERIHPSRITDYAY